MLSVAKRYGSSHALILVGVTRMPQLLCNPADDPPIFQTAFNLPGKHAAGHIGRIVSNLLQLRQKNDIM